MGRPCNNKLSSKDKIGKWTLISKFSKFEKRNRYFWNCVCECGNKSSPSEANLLSGKSKSCRNCSCKTKSEKQSKDLTGKRFGRLVVVARAFSNKKTNRQRLFFWLCKCDCGKEKIAQGYYLKSGTTNSCGCATSELKKIAIRKPIGEAAFNRLLASYKYGAEKRNYTFDLTKEEFKTLVQQQCYYCKSEPSNLFKFGGKTTSKEWKKLNEFKYNGIDRIDNKIGYFKENCVPCCIVCNHAKSDSSQSEFLAWVERVANNLKANTS